MAAEVPPDYPGLRIACQELVELLTDYLDGALEPPVLTYVESHLAICPPCQNYLAHLKETVGRLGRVEATEQLCEETRADVLAAFRDLMPRR